MAELAASATERAPRAFFDGPPVAFFDFFFVFFEDAAVDRSAVDCFFVVDFFFELPADVVFARPVGLVEGFFTGVFFLDAPLGVDFFRVAFFFRVLEPRDFFFEEAFFAIFFFFAAVFFDVAFRADDFFFEPAPERADFVFPREAVFRRVADFFLVDFLATAETFSEIGKLFRPSDLSADCRCRIRQ